MAIECITRTARANCDTTKNRLRTSVRGASNLATIRKTSIIWTQFNTLFRITRRIAAIEANFALAACFFTARRVSVRAYITLTSASQRKKTRCALLHAAIGLWLSGWRTKVETLGCVNRTCAAVGACGSNRILRSGRGNTSGCFATRKNWRQALSWVSIRTCTGGAALAFALINKKASGESCEY